MFILNVDLAFCKLRDAKVLLKDFGFLRISSWSLDTVTCRLPGFSNGHKYLWLRMDTWIFV